jgi:hypothetical protein
VYLLGEDLLYDGRVLGDAADDLRGGGGIAGVEEAGLLPQHGLQVQAPDPPHLPLARPAPAVAFCVRPLFHQKQANVRSQEF